MDLSEINKDDLNLIEKYLDGELTPEEEHSFNQRITEDHGFKDLLTARKEIREVWYRARNIETTKEEVRSIYQEGAVQEKNIFRIIPDFISTYRYYAIAASVVLITGILSVLLLINKNSKNTEIAKNEKNKTYQVQQERELSVKGKLGIYKPESRQIVLLSPDSEAVISTQKTILFKWIYKNDTDTHITILKKGINFPVLSEKISSSQTSILLPAGKLKPGVYTWFIGDNRITRTFIIKEK